MKKRIPYLFGFGVLAALGAAAYVWFFVYNKPHRDIENAAPDYTLTASALIREFDAGDTASDKKYNDKVIRFSGVPKKTETADSTVTLIFDDGTDHVVTTQLLPKYKNELPAPGTEITLKGLYNGFLAGDAAFGLPGSILLNKCSPVR